MALMRQDDRVCIIEYEGMFQRDKISNTISFDYKMLFFDKKDILCLRDKILSDRLQKYGSAQESNLDRREMDAPMCCHCTTLPPYTSVSQAYLYYLQSPPQYRSTYPSLSRNLAKISIECIYAL